MISYIRGELAAVEEDRIVVEAGGIGYGIFMPGSAIGRLPAIGSDLLKACETVLPPAAAF